MKGKLTPGKVAGKLTPGKKGAGGLLRDRRVQIAAAAALGLGLVALMRRGGGVAEPPGGATMQPAAALDSSTWDMTNALNQFASSLDDIRNQLGQQPSTGTGSDPTTGDPRPRPPQRPTPPWLSVARPSRSPLERRSAAGWAGPPARPRLPSSSGVVAPPPRRG